MPESSGPFGSLWAFPRHASPMHPSSAHLLVRATGASRPTRGLERGLWTAALAVQWLVTGYLVYLRLLAAQDGVREGAFYPAPFYHLLATMDWSGALVAATVLTVAVWVSVQPWVSGVAAALERHALVVAITVAVVFGLLSVTAHQAYPFTSDEYAPTFQSQIFARGRLTGQWPPDMVGLLVAPDSFLIASRVTGRCCSDYAPGHALLMTPFTALGASWACNPVLAGISIWLLAAVAREAFGRRAAGWAILFAITSPVFMAYGISFYSMMAHATCNLLYVVLLLRPTLPSVACAGLVGAFALTLHNPFPHAVFALPWIVWLALPARRFLRLGVLAACYAAVFLPIDAGWNAVESAIRQDQQPAVVATGEPPAAAEAAPPSTARVAWQQIERLQSYLGALELPSLRDLCWIRFASFLRNVAWDAPALVTLACYGAWRNRRHPQARLLAASALTTFAAYSLIPMSGGQGWGYRYMFPAWCCLPLLAGSVASRPRSAEAAADDADEIADADENTPSETTRDLLSRIGLAAVVAAAIALPLRASEIHAFIATHRSQLPSLPPGRDGMTTITCIDPREGYFRTDLVRNDPFLASGPYVFVSQGAANDDRNVAAVAARFGLNHRKLEASGLGTTWVLFRSTEGGVESHR